MKKLFLMLCLAFITMSAVAQQKIQVNVHNVVALDEQFYITFVIEGGKPSDFKWDAGEDFEMKWGPQKGRASSVVTKNGVRTETSQTSYSYILKPKKVGKFTINRAVATVDGKEIYSPAKTIEVVGSESSASSQQAQQQSQQSQQSQQQSKQSAKRTSPYDISRSDIFMRLSVNRTSVIMGEPISVTLKMYHRVDIAGFENVVFPTFDGFWSQETESPTNINFVRESYNGEIYNAAVLRRYMIIPQKPGTLTIDPAELTCLISVKSPSSSMFFDDYTNVRKNVISNQVTINVSSLPSGAPASFYGGVGEFSVDLSVTKDTVKAHEAAALELKVKGHGNISFLETPKISFPPDMEVYDAKVQSDVSRNMISGSKTYEYPFIPRSHGEFTIEPVKYSYYDVDARRYVTLETDPIRLVVLPGNEINASTPILPGVTPRDVKDLDRDIRYIKIKNHSLRKKGDFILGSVIFWFMIILLLAVFFLCWISLRTFAKRKADVVGTRNRKANKMALRRLSHARALLKKNENIAFYEELHKALLGYVSDKLNMPLSELSRDRISESLAGRSVPESDIIGLIKILDECEYARYAPDAGTEAMSAHYEAAVDVISSIDSKMKPKRKNMGAMLMLLLLMPVGMNAAAPEDSLWNAASEAYAQGQWSQAIEAYEQIDAMGLESAALYCNIGNAYYKEGYVSKAVLYYERSLKLDPSYSDAEHNLELVNAGLQDKFDPVPVFFFTKWMKDICYSLSSDVWAVIFLVFLAITLAMVLMFMLSASVAGRRTGFFAGLVTCLLMVFALTFSIWQKKDYEAAAYAVVMKGVVTAKSSPSLENSKDLYLLHEGTKVEVLDVMGDWSNVALIDGRQGWIPTSDIEKI